MLEVVIEIVSSLRHQRTVVARGWLRDDIDGDVLL